jgi:hypothetical protein
MIVITVILGDLSEFVKKYEISGRAGDIGAGPIYVLIGS